MHLVVVLYTYFHEAWDVALTNHGADILPQSEPEYAGRGTCLGRMAPGFVDEGLASRGMCRGASMGLCGSDGNIWMRRGLEAGGQCDGVSSAGILDQLSARVVALTLSYRIVPAWTARSGDQEVAAS